MNIRENDFKAYIELFHLTLEETSKNFLPNEFRPMLLHLSLLPARIIGYVSTQFGVAIEYRRATATIIEIRRGSARVEDLFVQAPLRIRDLGPLVAIGGYRTAFYNYSLSGAFPFRLTNQVASVSFGDTIFEANSWKRSVEYAEIFGDRSENSWTPEKAIARAKDEVLMALVEIQRVQQKNISLSEYIGSFKKKTVLVLGDYDDEGLARLEEIRDVLTKIGYEPFLLKDIPDHPYQDLRQKVVAVGAVSRFIVVDDSSKSGHLLEIQLCDQNRWVTVLLHADGLSGSWMTAGLSHTSGVILEQAYSPTDLEATLIDASSWAEKKLQELQVKFENTYPWRRFSS